MQHVRKSSCKFSNVENTTNQVYDFDSNTFVQKEYTGRFVLDILVDAKNKFLSSHYVWGNPYDAIVSVSDVHYLSLKTFKEANNITDITAWYKTVCKGKNRGRNFIEHAYDNAINYVAERI